jgi:membrane carboxypeptidase/penicillin-binding protein PbpC
VQWLLNGKLIATSPANVPIEHRTETGRHRLLALDARGAYDAVEVRVLNW